MRALRWILYVILALGALFGVSMVALSAPRPTGVEGAEADALARRIEAAVGLPGWEQTLAVKWTFAGRNEHLWDRQRQLDRVRWGDTEVLVDLGKADGRAFVDGEEMQGRRRERLVKKAYAAWINDSFWLNPLAKLFDDGVHRLKVEGDEGEALFVEYREGGLTPGDGYLWLLGEGDLPAAWRLWVSVIPIKGLKASWEGWQTLSTGARVSTLHQLGPVKMRITDVAGAASLAALEPGPDPFAPLMGEAPSPSN